MNDIDNFTWAGCNASLTEHQIIKSFIATEIQRSVSMADYFIDGLNAAKQGTDYSLSGAGNGYEFEAKKDGFELETLFPTDADKPILVSYQEILEALNEWKKQLI
ncbi:hypothetical protein [Celerinatantimonas sp. MCCC 1A17872]|uniref:hypothetical protein n=1 Tax=Celerinatantimonas sp. MCCC 1A17872 TaxID=3177514 RepID=UPI0038C3A2D8